MRKTDKKIDNQICAVLTDVCETALEKFEGFEWLTHLVNYSSFPKSLKVVCVFDTNDNLASFMTDDNIHVLSKLMQKKLFSIGVNIGDMTSHIQIDTEQNCTEKDGGKWSDRLNKIGSR
jgi:hypothetical protein